MYCSQCGEELTALVKFCAKCGAKNAAATPAPSVSAEPQAPPEPTRTWWERFLRWLLWFWSD